MVFCTIALTACWSAFGAGQAAGISPATSGFVNAARSPTGTEGFHVRWITVAAPGGHRMLAAVAGPEGGGPYPAVVVLHGSHGFAREYVQLAQELSRAGLVVAAACWFSGGVGAGKRFITPIDCPDAHPMARPSEPSAMQAVEALVQAVRTLPGVRADRVGLFGHSRGGGAALNYMLTTNDVQAIAVNSAGYPPDVVERADRLKAPILMLHGTSDSPADGGGPMTDVVNARQFEAALRRLGTRVDAAYYPGGKHNGIFADPGQRKDAVQRLKTFFARHLDE